MRYFYSHDYKYYNKELEVLNELTNDDIKRVVKKYFTNDKRSKIKKKINELLNSDIMEEKSYSDY